MRATQKLKARWRLGRNIFTVLLPLTAAHACGTRATTPHVPAQGIGQVFGVMHMFLGVCMAACEGGRHSDTGGGGAGRIARDAYCECHM